MLHKVVDETMEKTVFSSARALIESDAASTRFTMNTQVRISKQENTAYEIPTHKHMIIRARAPNDNKGTLIPVNYSKAGRSIIKMCRCMYIVTLNTFSFSAPALCISNCTARVKVTHRSTLSFYSRHCVLRRDATIVLFTAR